MLKFGIQIMLKKYGRKKADEIKASDVTEENSWKKAEIVEENGKVIIKGKDLIGAWPTVIAYKDKKLKGNCSFKIKNGICCYCCRRRSFT